MERRRLHGRHFVSVFSLMRDGRELAAALREARQLPDEDRAAGLKRVVDPYLAFVAEEARCPHTGLRLQDVWRYFRHTWSNQYTSVPGRTMAFLVRDRAAPFHPVIGIGALSSPIVQIKERDRWLGWHPDTFVEHALESPTRELGEWLRVVAETGLSEIYVADLLEEGVITPAELRGLGADTLERLERHGIEQRAQHHRFTQARDYKGETGLADVPKDQRWVARARTHLFRSKRALALAELLKARAVLDEHLGRPPSAEQLVSLLRDEVGKRAALRLLRRAKAAQVGIAMADISVCGAVPPYNPVLGGKLVAMLATSPEVVETYRTRYGEAESEIASAMAGRPIVRPATLVFLGTTSLYGVGSSQYNRVRIPAARLGGLAGDEIRYRELGKSRAFGTAQFRHDTVQALEELVRHSAVGQRVHCVFGEGVSPKLRKIREGLDQLGFPADKLMRHGRRRIVYGVALASNLREYLLGFDTEPTFLFDRWGEQASSAIADWWAERWLSMRVRSDSVLADVESHSLVAPVRHGARVTLPPAEPSPQIDLFDDLD